jgi:hypothetical protein
LNSCQQRAELKEGIRQDLDDSLVEVREIEKIVSYDRIVCYGRFLSIDDDVDRFELCSSQKIADILTYLTGLLNQNYK